MTTPTTVTPDPRHDTDPTVAPATGGAVPPAPRSARGKALTGVAVASAVLGLGLLLPGLLAVLAVLAGLVAIASIALLAHPPLWLFGAAAVVAVVVVMGRSRTAERTDNV